MTERKTGKEKIVLPTTNQVVAIAKEAGIILKDFFESKKFGVEAKSGGIDVVTEADIKVDEFVRKKLSEQFPGSDILTEETSGGKPYMHLKDSPSLWIVDPLDGTKNFARNNPHFGIAIAHLKRGKIDIAVSHLPIKSETYNATEGIEGAFLNGEKINVSSKNDITGLYFATGFSNNKEARDKTTEIIAKVAQSTGAIYSNGSPVADLCLLAKGELDVYVNPRLKPWDVAASAYIVIKAGGKITTITGKPWSPFCLDILATNGKLHDQTCSLI